MSAIDGLDIERPLDFQRSMLDRNPGEILHLTVKRAGSETPMKLSLRLGAVPDRQQVADQPAWEVLGIKLKAVPPEEFHKIRQTRYRGGLSVTEVRPDSPAASQGIVPGDVLVGMHIWETATLDNVAYILKRPDFAKLSPVKFLILRGDETLFGYLPVAAAKTMQR